jgi:phage tail-like protein
MAPRPTPFGAYNFLVEFGDGDSSSPLGGFSDVSGLGTEITMADYRNGNDKENWVRKVALMNKTNETTLKRGIMGVVNFGRWMTQTRRNPNLPRNILITLNDEQGRPVMRWKLINARPMKWTGPTLAAKGGSDVAMEELVLISEGLDFVEV